MGNPQETMGLPAPKVGLTAFEQNFPSSNCGSDDRSQILGWRVLALLSLEFTFCGYEMLRGAFQWLSSTMVMFFLTCGCSELELLIANNVERHTLFLNDPMWMNIHDVATVYTYVFIHTHANTHTHTYIYIYMHARIHAYKHTWHDMTWQDMTCHDMTRHDMTFHDITWHDITLHYITLPFITVHSITLHCIAYIHIQ